MRKNRPNWYKQRDLIEMFVARTTARIVSSLIGLDKAAASYYFLRLRQLVYDTSEHHELLEDEADKGYFDRRRKGRYGLGAVGKVFVFGLLKRNGRFTRFNLQAPELEP